MARTSCGISSTAVASTIASRKFTASWTSDEHRLRRLLAGESEAEHLEKRYLRSDREVVWAEVSVFLVHDGDGSPLHFVTHQRDITEARQAQVDLLASERPTSIVGSLCSMRNCGPKRRLRSKSFLSLDARRSIRLRLR